MHTAYDLVTASDAWHPNHRILNKRLVESARKNLKKLYVWTVNKEQDVLKVLNYSVDGIITDNVSLVRKIIDDQSQAS
jgi:glycerophosphoryl diester phosphodiesterase